MRTTVFLKDARSLMGEFGRHGEFLPKSAAYVLGYLDGLGLSLSELSMDVAEQVTGSYFELSFKARTLPVSILTSRSSWST